MSSQSNSSSQRSNDQKMVCPYRLENGRRINRNAFKTMITVVVGSQREKFFTDRAILMEVSDYFKNALSGPWIEAQSSEFALDQEDPQDFSIFLHWAYHGSIDVGWSLAEDVNAEDVSWNSSEASTLSENVEMDMAKALKNQSTRQDGTAAPAITRRIVMARLIKAFLLGTKLRSYQFRNDVIDAFDKCIGAVYLEPDAIRYVFNHTQKGSALRKIIVDDITWRSSRGRLRWCTRKKPHISFVADIAISQSQMRSLSYPDLSPFRNFCLNYHEHPERDNRIRKADGERTK